MTLKGNQRKENMDRRDFLKSAVGLGAAAIGPEKARAQNTPQIEGGLAEKPLNRIDDSELAELMTNYPGANASTSEVAGFMEKLQIFLVKAKEGLNLATQSLSFESPTDPDEKFRANIDETKAIITKFFKINIIAIYKTLIILEKKFSQTNSLAMQTAIKNARSGSLKEIGQLSHAITEFKLALRRLEEYLKEIRQ